MSMVERVARAIDSVQLWTRHNDWTSDRVEGSPIEVCRYGKDGEPDIVVVRRFSGAKKEDDALHEVVSEHRSRAAIEAMRNSIHVGMIGAFWRQKRAQEIGETGDARSDYDAFRAFFDAALSEEEERG